MQNVSETNDVVIIMSINISSVAWETARLHRSTAHDTISCFVGI
jgi:hypothetical protein